MESKADYRRVPITMPREMYTYMLKIGGGRTTVKDKRSL